MRLATNATRLAEFRRYVARDYYKEVKRVTVLETIPDVQGDVCKTSLLTPEQVYEKFPNLKAGEVRHSEERERERERDGACRCKAACTRRTTVT